MAALYAAFIREADGPLGTAVDLEAEIAAGPPADLVAPGGLLLAARVDGEPAGLGGVRHLDTEVAEVKSMYVAPAHRGTGLGRACSRRWTGSPPSTAAAPSASTPPTT